MIKINKKKTRGFPVPLFECFDDNVDIPLRRNAFGETEYAAREAFMALYKDLYPDNNKYELPIPEPPLVEFFWDDFEIENLGDGDQSRGMHRLEHLPSGRVAFGMTRQRTWDSLRFSAAAQGFSFANIPAGMSGSTLMPKGVFV